ncbi:acyltransferase [Brucella tritici]|uniref:acyltransferase n=1 Tax=Brucella tritici TaxID=94626 RepID=UPI0020011ECF|nr:acyltransferase [Brucella tritici]
MQRIHPTAIIDPAAKLADDVKVGAFSIIYGNVEIGESTEIGSHCEIGIKTPLGDGSPLCIGPKSMIRSYSAFYESSTFGPGLVTGHRVTVRELCTVGEDVKFGTLCDIQGHCSIGSHARFHSNVHIGQHAAIEDFTWIFPYVVLTNDPHPPSEVMMGVTIKRYAVIATMSTILPGVTIGEGALVGACSAVTKDVMPHRIAVGNPARDKGVTEQIMLRDGSDKPAYPWPSHFRRGYPEWAVNAWNTGNYILDNINNT